MGLILKFGPFELDRQNFELRHNGQPVKLDRTPLELLFFLAERAGTLVTREEAVGHIWGNGVFVQAESSLYTAVRKVRRALNDDIGEPRFIQTVSRKGYRFIAKVEEAQAASAPPATSSTAPRPRRISPWALWPALMCLLAIGTAVVRLRTAGHSHGPSKIMMAVLPLENLSGDPQQQYLADGITEEITTQLASLDPAHLRVMARTSAMQYKNTRKNTAQISGELGVAYLLEGSIRRSGSNVRITAQLIHRQTRHTSGPKVMTATLETC